VNQKPVPQGRANREAPEAEDASRLPPLVISLSYRRVSATFWAITAIIVVLGLLQQVYLAAYGLEAASRAADPFDRALRTLDPLSLGSENSLADWYGSILLALSAALLAATARGETRGRWRPYWFGLAAIFVFLSIDEAAQLHELWMVPMAPFYFTGVLHYSWVVPYGILCLVVGFIYLPFVRAQPEPLRRMIILSAALYLGATLGLEGVEGYCAIHYGWGPDAACHQGSALLEESLEMSALVIFITALLAHLRRDHGAVTIEL